MLRVIQTVSSASDVGGDELVVGDQKLLPESSGLSKYTLVMFQVVLPRSMVKFPQSRYTGTSASTHPH